MARAEAPGAYIGSEICGECHRQAYEAWVESHHAWAWREPSAGNVLAGFSGETFHHDGIDYRFAQDGDGGYRVSLTNQASQTVRDYAVNAIAGVAPLQQYLIETEPGRLQSFDVVWDVADKRWYHLYPDQDLPPEDGLHWSGPYKNWNARCAECHATGFEKNYDPGTKTYQSRQAEIGVGCEACHGPAEAHLAWARAPGDHEALEGLSPYGFSADFAASDPAGEIEVCAPCHSRREPLGDASPVAGSSFADHYNLSLLREGLYHPDGQILDEVYVQGSFLQSKMYSKGVQCSDCHEPHGARLKAEGNAVCTQCHNPAGREGFPSLVPADYDSPAHHFHPEESAGAACVSCHMIERVYMGIDGRRDHSFRVPRPDLSEETGSPNACTDCHEDRTAGWAAAVLKDRYPGGRSGSAHYGQVFAAARAVPGANNDALLALIAEPERAAIVRATALDLLARTAQPQEARKALDSFKDPNPLVRHAALSLLAALPPQDQLEQAIPLLEDPARSVRIEAARRLLGLGGVRYPDATLAKLRSALGEYQASLRAKADFPEIQLALGGLALSQRNLPAASGAFGEAVRLDPQLPQAWRMLGRIEEVKGRPEAALALLDQGLKANPGDQLLVLSKAQTLIAVREYEEAATLLETLL
ncbi:MAG: multiheme c-type cytochrome, partial [Limibacillus sp.]